MIKKLIKYDLKNMSKLLIWYYLFAIVLAGITRLINLGNNIQFISIIGSVFAGLTYASIATIIINMFIHIIAVFKNSFYKDESYLTHTLPVTKNQLLLSKYISSLIVVIASVLACVLSLFILLYSPEFMQAIKDYLMVCLSGFSVAPIFVVLLLVVIIFFEITSIIAMAFVSVIYGYSYNHKKNLKAVATFIALYLAVMYAVFLVVIGIFAVLGNVGILFAETLTQSEFLTLLWVALVCYALATFLMCWLGKKLFNKGVNVD